MKKVLLVVTMCLCFSVSAIAASSYQVTGPILAVKGDVITVQKGSEKWDIKIVPTTSTNAKGGFKVGDKVTIKYTMTADSVVVKK
jgi:opacity protein-like surface antigen